MYMVASMIRQRSKKRANLMREVRGPFVKEFLEEHPWCWRCTRYAQTTLVPRWAYLPHINRSTVVHEKLTRARGGSITDKANCVALCGSCHDEIHAHPRQATEDGWLIGGKKGIPPFGST